MEALAQPLSPFPVPRRDIPALDADPPGLRRLARLASVSPHMHEVFRLVEGLARTEVTVTIMGETGTGKDVLAHALHAESRRARGPFVVFDCSAVSPNLAESELFGHERGAFTGALAKHPGAFERAAGGTLFLDEVGELPLDLQPKLLRVLESRRVRRVGGTKDEPVDLRIIAATNRDLARQVACHQFRQDLYFRLAAAVVALPPLRDRIEDLPHLTRGLLVELGRPEVRISEDALALLATQPWPGNIRQIKNALACALAFVDAGVLGQKHLRLVAPQPDPRELDRVPLGGRSLAEIEKAAIKQTLGQTRGNKIQAAQVLGIAVSTLYVKIKKHQITF